MKFIRLIAKNSLFIIFIVSNFHLEMLAQQKYSNINSAPGAFSRMGFGPRGIALGNSISAVKEGNLSAYYNPALSVFQNGNNFSTAYTFLSLDRSLNYLNFTRKFEFYSSKDSISEIKKPRATAGFGLGIINSGVSHIDARDNQGFKRDELSTSENQFFLDVAIKFSDKVAIGLGVKLYYYKLYEDVTTSSIGFDLGAVYTFDKNWSFAFVITDLNAKYKWDTSPIYQQEGTMTENKFPTTKRIGVCFTEPEMKFLVSSEFVFDSYGSKILRLGGEYNIYDKLFLRAGADNLFLNNSDQPVHPSFGFSYTKDFDILSAGFEYAYVLEQYSPGDRHIIGINLIF